MMTPLEFARERHAGQVDKAGKPYIEHLMRVAATAKSFSSALSLFDGEKRSDIETVAILHDVLEDTPTFSIELLDLGVLRAAVASIELLTKGKSDSYDRQITRILQSGDRIAQIVKIADLLDNLSEERLALLSAGERQRLRAKYAPAARRLIEQLFPTRV